MGGVQIRLQTGQGHAIKVLVPNAQAKRMSRTCFRGVDRPLAGNFSAWRDSRELFRDREVRRQLAGELDSALAEGAGAWENTRLTLSLGRAIGWESTVPRAGIPDELLESFAPNRHSQALKISPDCAALRSPTTQLLTLIFSLRPGDRGSWTMIVHSVYPGFDIGELDGDLTQRHDRVFFDWNHQGVDG